MSFGCYHYLPRASWQSYNFTSSVYKTPTVGAPGRGQSRTLVVEKEVMAPCTYVRLALAAVPSGCILFRSLEFADVNGSTFIDSLLPGQALHFGDLDFIADHLGQLCLYEENAAPPHISIPDHGLAQASPTIVDSNALACRINAYLGANFELELSR